MVPKSLNKSFQIPHKRARNKKEEKMKKVGAEEDSNRRRFPQLYPVMLSFFQLRSLTGHVGGEERKGKKERERK